jgi:hypothetical protein
MQPQRAALEALWIRSEDEEEEPPRPSWYILEAQTEYLGRALPEFNRRASSLGELADDFSTMTTTLQMGQVIARSDEELPQLQRELRFMRNAIKNMPRQERESFEPPIANCEGVFAELQARFAALKGELRLLITLNVERSLKAEQDSGQSTSPLEDPNPPRELEIQVLAANGIITIHANWPKSTRRGQWRNNTTTPNARVSHSFAGI